MERLEVRVDLRREAGKGAARKLRRTQKVPAVFYGPHVEKPVALAIEEKDAVSAVRAGANVLLVLRSGEAKEVDGKTAILKDEAIHPVTGELRHVDLLEVRMDEAIKVQVPVACVGKAKGVADGGILQVIVRELEVRCLPADIPQKIEVDVSELEIGDSLHVSDITLPKGITVVGDVDYTLAACVPPEKEEVAPAPAVAAEAVPGAPEAVPGAPGAPAAAPAEAAAGTAPGAATPAGAKAEPKPAEGRGKAEGKSKKE